MKAPVYDAVIFDCDGVMFDTTEANQAYYNAVLSHFGKPLLTPSQFAYIHSHTVDDSIAHLFEAPEAAANAHAYRKAMSYLPFITHMQPEPGLVPLLTRLRPACRTAIATNRTDTMARVLAQFGLTALFDMVVCAHDVPRPKPAPDPLMHILAAFGIEPGQALFIGDSAVDEGAAAAAGVPFAAYANPSLNAEYHVNRLSQIADICFP
ncbi:MAG: HAD-IA family hydrolase [Pseudomonadota bacterium]